MRTLHRTVAASGKTMPCLVNEVHEKANVVEVTVENRDALPELICNGLVALFEPKASKASKASPGLAQT